MMEKEHFIETLIPDVMKSLDQIKGALGIATAGAVIGCTSPAAPTFADRNLQPPSQFYVTQDFQVRVRSVTSQTNEIVTLTVNMLIDNRVVPVSMQSLPFTNAVNTITLRIPATGFLLSASLQVAVATVRCMTYAVVELLDQNGTFQNTLFAGYVAIAKPIAYPPIQIEDSFSGNGRLIGVNPTPVGLGDFIITCPANRIQKVRTIQTYATTGAVVANRSVNAYFFIAGAFAYFYATSLQPANTEYWYSTAKNMQNVVLNDVNRFIVHWTIPELMLFAGDQVACEFNHMQAGDAVATDVWLIEEWLTL